MSAPFANGVCQPRPGHRLQVARGLASTARLLLRLGSLARVPAGWLPRGCQGDGGPPPAAAAGEGGFAERREEVRQPSSPLPEACGSHRTTAPGADPALTLCVSESLLLPLWGLGGGTSRRPFLLGSLGPCPGGGAHKGWQQKPSWPSHALCFLAQCEAASEHHCPAPAAPHGAGPVGLPGPGPGPADCRQNQPLFSS